MTVTNKAVGKTNMAWTAVVRVLVMTVIAKILGSPVVAPIVDWFEEIGLPLDTVLITNIVSLFIVGLVVLLVNKFGPKFAVINQVISLGMARTGPAYVPANADAVVLTANKNESDTITSPGTGGTDTVTSIDTPPPGPN